MKLLKNADANKIFIGKMNGWYYQDYEYSLGKKVDKTPFFINWDINALIPARRNWENRELE